MCGIICYLGNRAASPILVNGLRRLEYRGYDSSGIAVLGNGGIRCERAVGKIDALSAEIEGQELKGNTGIGHTRWATHGKPSVENAHPHADCGQRIFVVHNGIVENYQSLRSELIAKGHTFRSETDTEVLAHLIEDHYQGDLEKAVRNALEEVEGTYGIGVICADEPRQIVVARLGSPLILGIRNEEVFAASDASALLSHTREVIYLQDGDVAVLDNGGFRVNNLHGRATSRDVQILEWDEQAADRHGYVHFMLKEIFEQPQVLTDAIRGRLIDEEGIAKFGGLESVSDQLLRMRRLIVLACGTSFYAGLLGRYIVETCTNFPVEVDLASEFHYRKLNLEAGTTVLAISQSGETLDTLAVIREIRRRGALALGLVNVVGSSIARETDAGIYNHAGPEIGVASTKAFLSQVTILYLIALLLGRHQQMSLSEGQDFVRELRSLPDKIQSILDGAAEIEGIASKYAGYRNFLYVGRKFSYPVALEGALKLKEIAYLHAEGYAAGEMKHGPIALIEREFPCVCLAPRDSVRHKMVSNIQEIKSRGGLVLVVGTEGDTELQDMADDFIGIPAIDEIFTPFLTVIPLQLLAYYIASANGCEIDQPRNLAKSVTVE